MRITVVISFVVCVFAATRSFFLAVGWFTRDHEDLTIRRHLDRFVEALDQQTPRKLISGFFKRLVSRVEASRAQRRRHIIAFILISLFLNAACITMLLEGYARLEKGISGLQLLTDINQQYPLPVVLGVSLSVPLLAALFDLLSLWVTWKLVNRAAQDTTLPRIIFHIMLDVIVATTATLWSLMVFVIAENTLLHASGKQLLFDHNLSDYLTHIGQRIVERPGYPVGILTLGFTSALPTLAYLALAGFFFLIFISPTPLKRFGSRIAYLVTTDDRPFFSQIGNLLAYALSILTLLFSILLPEHQTDPGTNGTQSAVEAPLLIAPIDRALRRDRANWGLRSYNADSVEVTNVASDGTRVDVEGTFNYSEFGTTYEIDFEAEMLRQQDQTFLLIDLCWRTLGGIDCIDQR